MPGRRPYHSMELWDLLSHGEMEECRLAPVGSNYTFYTILSNGARGQCQVVYKPQRGEAPLWDFPEGTLYLREYAAYLLSEALGWGFVPPTLIRDGNYGIGSVQLYVESDAGANYFTLRASHRDEMLRVCTFDIIANNADRKASHCLLDPQGSIWAIDHGVTFHSQEKLRTVIWDFIGEPVPQGILEDLRRLLQKLHGSSGLREQLSSLLRGDEMDAVLQRTENLVDRSAFPPPGLQRAVPWPWL